MQRQHHPVIAETSTSQHDQSEQDATSEPESEPHYYANPELLAEKCRQLEKIPFVLVEPVVERSEESKRRIKILEEKFRQDLKQGVKPRLELESTVLGGPLLGGWPKIEPEAETIDYPLAETEEEWFAWKRKIDAERDRRRQMPSRDPNKDVGSTREAERTKSTSAKDTGISQTPSDAPVKGKENGLPRVNRSSRAVAPEAEWNDYSIEGAPQSTPVRRDHGVVPTPQAPARQLASVPGERFQPRPTTPFADLQVPRILQRIGEGRVSHAMPMGVQYSQPKGNGSKLQRQGGSFASLMHGPSPESLPITPVSPTIRQMPRAPTMSPSNGMMSRESVESWRKRSALVNPQEGVSQPRSSHRRSQDSPPSPTTTYFLYGSQEIRASPRPRLNRTNSYSRELEEELERERQIFDLHKAVNGYSEPRRGTWDVGSYEEDAGFRSQEARAVSSFVENDLGDPYRDAPYAALNPRLDHYDPYENPYDY